MRHVRLAAAALLALAGCAEVGKVLGASLEKPRLTFLSVTPREADLEGVTLLVRYRVENPNAVGLELATLDYRLDVDGRSTMTKDELVEATARSAQIVAITGSTCEAILSVRQSRLGVRASLVDVSEEPTRLHLSWASSWSMMSCTLWAGMPWAA